MATYGKSKELWLQLSPTRRILRQEEPSCTWGKNKHFYYFQHREDGDLDGEINWSTPYKLRPDHDRVLIEFLEMLKTQNDELEATCGSTLTSPPNGTGSLKPFVDYGG